MEYTGDNEGRYVAWVGSEKIQATRQLNHARASQMVRKHPYELLDNWNTLTANQRRHAKKLVSRYGTLWGAVKARESEKPPREGYWLARTICRDLFGAAPERV